MKPEEYAAAMHVTVPRARSPCVRRMSGSHGSRPAARHHAGPARPEDGVTGAPGVVACEELIAATPETACRTVIVGYNWTLVDWESGTGLASTPGKGAGGARATEATGSYAGRPLRALARLSRSANPYERTIGCAAINAGLNRHDLAGSDGNGLEVPADATGRIVVVGRFPGLKDRLPGAIVLERNPGPGDLPAEAAPEVVPGCSHLLVTASAWANASLSGLLALAAGARVSLVGPGTPLAPSLLGRYGIHRLGGFIATDPAGLRRSVAEGAGVRQFRHQGRSVLLDCPGSYSAATRADASSIRQSSGSGSMAEKSR